MRAPCRRCLRYAHEVSKNGESQTSVKSDLSVSEVLKYFGNSIQPAIKPKAGEIYLISWKDDSCRLSTKLAIATMTTIYIFPEHAIGS